MSRWGYEKSEQKMMNEEIASNLSGASDMSMITCVPCHDTWKRLAKDH